MMSFDMLSKTPESHYDVDYQVRKGCIHQEEAAARGTAKG